MSERKTVLCVDDEPEIIELLKEKLEEKGIDVLSANSGNSAFDVYQKSKIDCLITDVRMPDGTGVELITKIREENKKLPVYLITGHLDHSEKQVRTLKIEAVIFKPFDIDELADTVLHTLNNLP